MYTILRWIWKVNWKSPSCYSCKPKKTPPKKNNTETTGKNTPAGTEEVERKKHSDTEEVEQSGRAVD